MPRGNDIIELGQAFEQLGGGVDGKLHIAEDDEGGYIELVIERAAKQISLHTCDIYSVIF